MMNESDRLMQAAEELHRVRTGYEEAMENREELINELRAEVERLKAVPPDPHTEEWKQLSAKIIELKAENERLLIAIDELSKRICTLRQLRKNDYREHEEQIAALKAKNDELHKESV